MNTGFASSTGKKIAASLKASFVLPLLFLGVGSQAPIAMAQSPGMFTATGNMTTARADHSANLLLNGKVLIAGGYSQLGLPLASAELYDPASGTFAPTGDMTAAGTGPAILLPDGKVSIGGRELYDPSTGTFTATGDLIPSGSFTLLGNGKVLIAGNPTAELYDPATGTFAVTGAYAGSYTGRYLSTRPPCSQTAES